MYGGEDPAIITCEATGGNLSYLWEVDLGDIFPITNDNSKVRFTGSSCCVGDKVIKCTVSNDKGSVSKEVHLTILEHEDAPEIITIELDNTEMSYKGGVINMKCFAIGGDLNYLWEADMGTITPVDEEGWEVNYTADETCVGTRKIMCTVTNDRGIDTLSVNVNVTE